MRIATWNVNSIGARLPRLLDWLETRKPGRGRPAGDQVHRCQPSPSTQIAALGYQSMPVGDGRWNGVAILSRVGLAPVSRGLPGMTEARYASADCGGLRVVSVYVPNGRAIGDAQFPLQAGVAAAAAADPR